MNPVDYFILSLLTCVALVLFALAAHDSPGLLKRGPFVPAYLVLLLTMLYIVTTSI